MIGPVPLTAISLLKNSSISGFKSLLGRSNNPCRKYLGLSSVFLSQARELQCGGGERSDGQGGGGYRIKGMKEETEDSLAIRRCLRGVVQLLVSVEGKEEGIIRNGSRMEKARHSKRAGLRKGGSAKSPRRENHGHSDVGEETEKERKPLKLLEIVLVKRSPWAMVLREALGLVHALRDIPVKGTLRICFELNGRKSVWATKRKELWEGTTSNSEPDGAKLLHDLQHLRVFRPPDIQPIMSPAEFKYVTLSKQGRLLISPTALGSSSMAVQDLIMPATPRPKTALQPAEKQRTDSFAFIMAEGISLLGSALLPNMPTREEGNVEEREYFVI
ncbi:hypothetical protein AOQ84DRAFT_444008 [Glonium stellatum]|uniref:Uncharacterized protein n=1 Tax=Glonium stellatum TaxID=574774 RepID=A0A8E2JLF7_9PEZI|nr:hypothetical protein AOQ84DRAFT_444008 [Glonium stellatum]